MKPKSHYLLYLLFLATGMLISFAILRGCANNGIKLLGYGASINADEWDEKGAKRIQAHLNHENPIVTISGRDTVPLLAMNIDVKLLQRLINEREFPWLSRKYERILIIPAIDSGHSGDTKNTFFNFIFAGVEENGKISTTDALDYCQPCPAKCPEYEEIDAWKQLGVTH